jgi:hypothetical protein
MGKKIVSGASLPKKLEDLVWRFRDHMKQSRENGRTSPTNPITALRLTEAYKKTGIELNNIDICAMVNFLRRNNVPIASGGNGYFYATSESELETTKKMLRDKIRGEQAALGGLEMAFTKTNEMFEAPATEAPATEAPATDSAGSVLETARQLFNLEEVNEAQ